ncbi:protein kinase C and casein kinase substrate in neurons protein 1 isoform X2 [Pseudomyrmex gracilis]|uniref:protein kinase C and casein kinase substrate in neurons protein 1 isoform X2 n=1 Tax=Pseudomyrmex gracilis TaxID=219809 RepID=UPI0009959BB4|nr:protein kinase C and casein kinase substrate in neurons protein 1 isoform X2 [Pseudomyrmex gracilis]
MSQHSDDNAFTATSDSFWEPNNYKRTTRRIEDGYKLCDSLISLVQERAEIERSYSKALKNWSKNWNEKIEKGPEYGTTEAACKGVLLEADRLCDLHMRIREELCNDIVQHIKTWQKDSYHKSMMTLKERKEMEEAFKKAQKPWVKLLQKVEKAKSEYHNSCKSERTAATMERNAMADSSLSPDQKALTVRKLQDRVHRAKEEVQKAKEKYQAALTEITQYNSKYMEDMSLIFDKCQEMEAQRLRFFQEVLFKIHKCLNISQDSDLRQIYEEFHHTISNADYKKDLKWWSHNHGTRMAMNWPEFEDYTEEFREITKGSKSKEALPAGSITLINQRPFDEDLHDYSSINDKSKSKSANRVSIPTSDTNNAGSSKNNTASSNKQSPEHNNEDNVKKTVTNGTNDKQESNPFEEEEWDDEGSDPLVDNGEPGVRVRALYDYDAGEADELSFRQGDIFEKLEEQDSQGWCKGRKDGRVGLYPGNYVMVLSQ